tara:strand:+ start:317 stop:1381 length:1065 start_codon:yes stop_codon:yes gene_type:complete
MFPANMPEMPPEMMGPVMDNPQGFADAMGSGMEAFSAAMEGGGGMEAAFEAFGDAAGPMMADMGVPMEVFEAVGDMVGAAVGPAMMMGPADAGGGDMGAMMMDAVDMMMPDGMNMPPEVGGAMMDMGTAMGDAGVMPHDVAGEMMAPPGEPGYPMPCDAAGDPVMVPGDPGSVPMMDMGGEPILQAPPADGAMADMGTMMPPPGGYDHPPMTGDMMMPPPMNMDIAMMGPNDTLESMGMNPDGSGGAYESGTMDMGAMGSDSPLGVDAPGYGDVGGMGAMADAMGGSNEPGPTAEALAADAMDAAMGTAMDGAMDQGGPAGGDAEVSGAGLTAEEVAADHAGTDDPVDPSAGMG